MNTNEDVTGKPQIESLGHLINPISNPVSQADAERQLAKAHAFLVDRTRARLNELVGSEDNSAGWGCFAKRATVDLSGTDRPGLVGKVSERIIEAINMCATLERLLDALRWFSEQPEMRDLLVLECHPSTSSAAEGNDLALGPGPGAKRVICEVTDVVRPSAGQNKKEQRDLESLGCKSGVPDDAIRRFICTSVEFGGALCSESRTWAGCRYRYYWHKCYRHQVSGTMLLEVKPPSTLTLTPVYRAALRKSRGPAARVETGGYSLDEAR